jgi:hypothetical protein
MMNKLQHNFKQSPAKNTTFVVLYQCAVYILTNNMSNEVSIAEAMRQFLEKSKMKGQVQAMQIEDLWEELMGKTIARYTDKIQIIQTTLYITTSVAPLKKELLYQRGKIMQRVNEALNEQVIKSVVIQ